MCVNRREGGGGDDVEREQRETYPRGGACSSKGNYDEQEGGFYVLLGLIPCDPHTARKGRYYPDTSWKRQVTRRYGITLYLAVLR